MKRFLIILIFIFIVVLPTEKNNKVEEYIAVMTDSEENSTVEDTTLYDVSFEETALYEYLQSLDNGESYEDEITENSLYLTDDSDNNIIVGLTINTQE